MNTFSPDEILTMDEYEIGKHMSGAYGPAKFGQMHRTIHAMARSEKLQRDALSAVYDRSVRPETAQ